jgi:tetratricopeptide (TPR) repeat protein
LFLSLAVAGICQNRGADSLRNLLQDPKLSDQARVDLLNNLSYELYDVNDSAAFIAAQKALALAEKIKYQQGIKYAYTLIGLGHNANGNYREALQYFVMSDRIDVPDMLHIASYNQVLLGNTFRDLAEYDSAEFYYNKAMSIINKTGNKAYKARVHKNLGQLYLILWKNADALKQLEMAEDLLRGSVPDVYQLADVLSLYGQAYENLLDYDKAQIYFGRMCEVANARNDSYHKIICVLNKADLTNRRGDFAAALQYCFDAIEMSKLYQYPPQMVEIYLKTGEIYMELSQYALASKYLFEALKISERLGLRYQTAEILSAISWINKDQGNFSLALDYINRSQKIREDIGDQHGISYSQNIRGLIYYQQKRYEEALQEFDKSIAIRTAIGHEKGVAAGLYNRSLVYQDLGQFETTYKLQMQALAIDQKTDDKYNLSIDYNTLAELLVQMNRLDEAERYMLLAHDLAKATQSKC